MAKIKTESEYNAAIKRIEELAPLFDDNAPMTDPNLIEYKLLSDLVEEYEDEHYPIASPSLASVLKLRMHELGLNRAKLSQMLGVSSTSIGNYISGKSEPTLRVGREMSRKLGIDARVVLGV